MKYHKQKCSNSHEHSKERTAVEKHLWKNGDGESFKVMKEYIHLERITISMI